MATMAPEREVSPFTRRTLAGEGRRPFFSRLSTLPPKQLRAGRGGQSTGDSTRRSNVEYRPDPSLVGCADRSRSST
jgi:hypothetical protein